MVKARGQIEVKINRGNKIEIIDVTDKLNGFISQGIFDLMKKQTAEAGRGDVIEAVVIVKKSNFKELVRNYNNLNNEGGDGYIPEEDFFTSKPEYKTWTETVVIK